VEGLRKEIEQVRFSDFIFMHGLGIRGRLSAGSHQDRQVARECRRITRQICDFRGAEIREPRRRFCAKPGSWRIENDEIRSVLVVL